MKVVIVAGGKGERMGILTTETPKSMLLFKGKPILDHILASIPESYEVGIVIGHHGEIIEKNYKDKVKAIIDDRYMAGDAKALYCAKKFLAGEQVFIVLNGDVIIPKEDISEISYFPPPCLGVAVVKYPCGLVEVVGPHIKKIKEKPYLLINAGLYYLDSRVWNYIGQAACLAEIPNWYIADDIPVLYYEVSQWKHFTSPTDLEAE